MFQKLSIPHRRSGLGIILLFGALPLFAEDHSCTIYAGGGFTSLNGNDSPNFKSGIHDGWKTFTAGGGFALTPLTAHNPAALFVTVDFLYSGMDLKSGVLTAAQITPNNVGIIAATDGRANFYSTMLNFTVRSIPTRRASVYGFGGFGWFSRDIVLTGASTEGSLLQPNAPAVFRSGGDSGAFDIGAGVQGRIPEACTA